MIKIDLNKLESAKLNINEYLTLLKIYYLSKDSDIPFSSTTDYINTLILKKYLAKDGLDLLLTDQAKILINGESDIDEIINYFKEVTGKRKISSDSKSNRKYIKDRLAQGYSIDDLKAVIDIKHKEWHNSPSMSKYLRIETLFNQTKFQMYIGEVESKEIEPKQTDNFRRI